MLVVRIYLARHGKAVEGYLDMAKDEKPVNHSDADHGPNVLVLGRKIHGGEKGVHCCQRYLAVQRMDVADRMQEQPRVSLVIYHH